MEHFTSVLKDVLLYLTEGVSFLKDIFNCFPDPIQQLMFAGFVVLIGFPTLKLIFSIFG